MTYSVLICRSAEKEFQALPVNVQERMREKILSLENNPRPYGTKKLKNSNDYRLRIGDYRVLYRLNDAERHVMIVSIAHRREVYR